MTMLIAVNLGDYAIIAADKRSVFLGEKGEVSKVISDNEQKLIPCNIGVVTGSGYVDLLDDFKLLVKHVDRTSGINSTNVFLDIARFVYEKNLTDKYSKFTKTNYLISYLTEIDGEVKPRIAIIYSGEPTEFRIINDIFVSYGTTQDELEDLKKYLKANLVTYNKESDSDLFKSIETNIGIISSVFKNTSTPINSVSENADYYIISKDYIGFHKVDN